MKMIHLKSKNIVMTIHFSKPNYKDIGLQFRNKTQIDHEPHTHSD